jgi:hypothetical protein
MDGDSNLSDLQVFLQEELVFFFFHNYRETSKETDAALIQRLSDVLARIKYDLPTQYKSNYLGLFYRLIGYVRSIVSGKGDHHFAYLMLFVWYKYYPTLAVYALHRFVVCTDGQHATFGSWRDIKYLCEFIKTSSEKGQDHSFIDVCCDFVNTQLDSDLQIQHVYALPKHNQTISNVAKWVPREHKQFDWLYHKLVLHWIKKNKPFIMNSATDRSYLAAISKSSRIYRKKIASLNKTIDTTQIKQCARNRRDIIPQHVSRYTQMKQPNLVFGYGENDTDDRLSCSQHFKEWLDCNLSNDDCNVENKTTSRSAHVTTPLPIYHYVKLARQLIANSSHLYPEDVVSQKDILDKQWTAMSKSFIPRQGGYSIPMIDVSDIMYSLNSDCYYSSIGYAIIFAQCSSIANRVLVVGNKPTWINLDTTAGFVSIVEHIHSAVSSSFCTNANYNKAFHLIANTIRDAELTRHDIRHLRLAIFSTFSQLSNKGSFYDDILSIFAEHSVQVPFIAFWNVSKRFGDYLPCSIHQKSAIMISGFSPFIFNTMLKKFKRYHTNPFHAVCNILKNPHYDILEDYISRLVIR